MFGIYLVNFGYYHEQMFETISEAVAFGKTKGFEFNIVEMRNKDIVGGCYGVSMTWVNMNSDYPYNPYKMEY